MSRYEDGKLSRRSFIAGTGIAAALGMSALAGCKPSGQGDGSGNSGAGADISWDYEADVVVVGAGGAGHMAACAAHEAGAKVLMIEKGERIGGDTAISGGITIGPWPERTKQETGIDDSKELWLEDQKKSAPYSQKALDGREQVGDLSYIERFADLMPGTFAWCQDVAKFTWFSMYYCKNCLSPQPTWDSAFPRDWNSQDGIIKPLAALIESYGDVEVLTGTQVYDLIKNAEGRVIGVYAITDKGQCIACKAHKGVLLSTGSFIAGRDMVEKYLDPAWGQLGTCSSFTNTGDGHKLAQRAGAKLNQMNLGTHWVPVKNDNGSGGVPTYSMIYSGSAPIYQNTMPGIFVNYDGKRFVNENIGYSIVGYRIMEQRHSFAWYVVDANGAALVNEADETELIAKADTIEELAKQMLVPADVFAAEIARYNGFVDAGADADFGKDLTGIGRIETAPFYAIASRTVPYQSYGGIAVDLDGRVLTAADKPIPGLYAAGICTGSFAAQAGLFYLGGVSQSLAFGRQAGQVIAAAESWE